MPRTLTVHLHTPQEMFAVPEGDPFTDVPTVDVGMEQLQPRRRRRDHQVLRRLTLEVALAGEPPRPTAVRP